MSHSIEHGNITFICNGDMDGDVEIVRSDTGQQFTVPAKALRAFVADWQRNRFVAWVEALTDDQMLGLPFCGRKEPA